MRKRTPGIGRPEYLQFRPYRAIVANSPREARRDSVLRFGAVFLIGAVVSAIVVGLPVALLLVMLPAVLPSAMGSRSAYQVGPAGIAASVAVIAFLGGLWRTRRR